MREEAKGGVGLSWDCFSTLRTSRNPKLDKTRTVRLFFLHLLPFDLFQLDLILVVNCGFPPRPKNGSFVGNETTFRSSLQFKCDDGFELEGSETRMCTSDKNWSGKEVSCIRK